MALREGNMGTGQSRRLTLAGILLLAGMQSHAGDLSFFHEIPHGSEADISQTGADLMAYVEQTGNNQASYRRRFIPTTGPPPGFESVRR